MPWKPIHDIHVLENGHLMVQRGPATVAQIDPETKQVVWEYDSATRNGNAGKRVEVHAFQRLPGGLTLIAESGPARLIKAWPRGRSPLPASRMTRLDPAAMLTHSVLPPYQAVAGPGVGMEPRVPQNLSVGLTRGSSTAQESCRNLSRAEPTGSGHNHPGRVTAFTRGARPA